jgi:hypothetical protein
MVNIELPLLRGASPVRQHPEFSRRHRLQEIIATRRHPVGIPMPQIQGAVPSTDMKATDRLLQIPEDPVLHIKAILGRVGLSQQDPGRATAMENGRPLPADTWRPAIRTARKAGNLHGAAAGRPQRR